MEKVGVRAPAFFRSLLLSALGLPPLSQKKEGGRLRAPLPNPPSPRGSEISITLRGTQRLSCETEKDERHRGAEIFHFRLESFGGVRMLPWYYFTNSFRDLERGNRRAQTRGKAELFCVCYSRKDRKV